MRISIMAVLMLSAISCRQRSAPMSDVLSFNSTAETDEAAVYKMLTRYPVIKNNQPALDEHGQPAFVESGCTLTAYSKRHAITAAHCVIQAATGMQAKPEDIQVVFPDGTFVLATKVIAHPEWLTKSTESNGADSLVKHKKDKTKDLALIEFDEVFEEYKPLSLQKAQPGHSKIKIVGFGMNGYQIKDRINLLAAPELDESLLAMKSALPADGAAFIDTLRPAYQQYLQQQLPSTDPNYATVDRIIEKLDKLYASFKDADGKYIKRSGMTTLGIIANSIIPNSLDLGVVEGDGMLVFTGKFLESAFEDELDRTLFKNLLLYAPDENTDTAVSEGSLAASFGDSGGPMLDEKGAILGVASTSLEDADKMEVYSMYVNLQSASSKAFFAARQAEGWAVPVAASTKQPDSTPDDDTPEDQGNGPGAAPNPGEGSGSSESAGPNADMFAALASPTNDLGTYHVQVSAGQNQVSMWICEDVNTIEACKDPLRATQSLKISPVGPQGRTNFQTNRAINILKPFAVMGLDPSGYVSGVVVKGAKR